MKYLNIISVLLLCFFTTVLYANQNSPFSVKELSILIYQMHYQKTNVSALEDFPEILKRLPKNLSDKLASLPPDSLVTRKILISTLSLYLSPSLISDIIKEGNEEEVLNKDQVSTILKKADFKKIEPNERILTYQQPKAHDFSNRLENALDEIPEKLVSGE